MLKTVTILKERFLHKDRSSMERMEKSRVKAAIEDCCDKYLSDANDLFTFEALPSALDNTIAVIEEPALADKYDFWQITETMFEVRLKEII